MIVIRLLRTMIDPDMLLLFDSFLLLLLDAVVVAAAAPAIIGFLLVRILQRFLKKTFTDKGCRCFCRSYFLFFRHADYSVSATTQTRQKQNKAGGLIII